MVNEEIVKNTVKKMREAGISESMISSTLADLGLSAGQIQGYISGTPAGSAPVPDTSTSTATPPPAPPVADAVSRDHELLASRTSEKVVQRLNESKIDDHSTQHLKDNITHLAMEQHGQQLQDTHQSVMDLHDKIDGTNMDTMGNRMAHINSKLEQLENDMRDVKASSSALQSLMQKILEANQQLLFETKNKK